MSRKNVSFATFNLLNLQKPGQPIYGNAKGWCEDVYERKISWSFDRLRRLAADVVGFQELWAEEPLDRHLHRSGLAATHTAPIAQDHSGKSIVCAGAVRKDILEGEPSGLSIFLKNLFPNPAVMIRSGISLKSRLQRFPGPFCILKSEWPAMCRPSTCLYAILNHAVPLKSGANVTGTTQTRINPTLLPSDTPFPPYAERQKQLRCGF